MKAEKVEITDINKLTIQEVELLILLLENEKHLDKKDARLLLEKLEAYHKHRIHQANPTSGGGWGGSDSSNDFGSGGGGGSDTSINKSGGQGGSSKFGTFIKYPKD